MENIKVQITLYDLEFGYTEFVTDTMKKQSETRSGLHQRRHYMQMRTSLFGLFIAPGRDLWNKM